MQQDGAALDMAEKTVAQAGALVCAFDQARDVGDDEFLAGFLPSIPICIPSKTVFGSMLYLQTVVINYLHAHLDDLHLDAAELTQTAFIEAFPCTSGP